jgi:putative DNA primase/helicase
MSQKPKSQNADLAHLPAALAPLCQEKRFVLWRWQRRREKWTKPTFMPNGANAETDNPATWSDHAAVIDTITGSDGVYDGIGFVLRDLSGLAVVDLDNCLSPKARPDSWAQAWLKATDGAYVERTPSGRGLRIIGISSGKKIQRRWTIDEGRPDAAIEIYRGCNRYVTLTGAQISGGTTLQPIDVDAIVAHYDALKPWRTGKTKRTRSKKSTNGSDGQTDFNGAAGSFDFDAIIRNGAPNGQRSELFQACVWHLAAAKKTVEEIVALLEQYPNGIGAKYAGRLAEEVERSYAKWKAEREPRAADDATADTAGGAAEPEEPSHWDRVDRIGIPVPSVANARRAIRALNITCRRDAFHDRFLIEGRVITKGRVNLDHTVLEKALGVVFPLSGVDLAMKGE